MHRLSIDRDSEYRLSVVLELHARSEYLMVLQKIEKAEPLVVKFIHGEISLQEILALLG